MIKTNLSVVLILVLGVFAQIEVKADNLFIHSMGYGNLSEKEDRILNHLKSQKMNTKMVMVGINKKALLASEISLNISHTPLISVRMRRLESVEGTTHWVAESSASVDYALFVMRDGNLTGKIHHNNSIYNVRPVGRGLHVIMVLDPSALPTQHPPESKKTQRKAAYNKLQQTPKIQQAPLVKAQSPSNSSSAIVPRFCNSNISHISVVFFYTPAIENTSADITSLAEYAVKEANIGFENSGIDANILLAGVYKVDYTESENFSTNHGHFASTNDGYMDEVHAIRNQLKADVMVLIISDAGYCGLATLFSGAGVAANAVMTLWGGCILGAVTFSHELGHVLGADHDIDNDNSPSVPFTYNHGYKDENRRIRTIMSYVCKGVYCTQIPYWSNPQQNYGGGVLGVSGVSENVRVLQYTAPIISKYR